MKTSKQLREERGGLIEEGKNLLKLAETEKRELTDDEQTRMDTIHAEVDALKVKVNTVEKQERLNAEAALLVAPKANDVSDKDKRDVATFSLVKAIRSQLPNQKLEGIELEMHQEAKKEANERGLKIEGVGVPAMLMTEKRDLNVGTDGDGGYTVETEVDGFIPVLRPRLQVEALGATMLRGLVGNVDIPRNNLAGAAAWEGEGDDNAEAVQTFDKLSLSPKRVGGFSYFSKQLLAQSSIDVEAFVRNDLEMAIKIAVDAAAINGAGSSGVPEGILNTTGIGNVAGGTNGLAPTRAHIIGLETEIAVDNADIGNMAYLTTPGVRGKLKNTATDSGSGIFVWGNGMELNGYNAQVSTQVPNDLTKGSGTALNAILFGVWSELMIGNWAGMDLVVDPYTLSKKAQIQIVANTWWDLAVRHAAAFSAMKDAIIV